MNVLEPLRPDDGKLASEGGLKKKKKEKSLNVALAALKQPSNEGRDLVTREAKPETKRQ